MSTTASIPIFPPRPLATNGISYPAVEHTAAIVAAYVSHNPVSPERLPELIGSVYGAVNGLFSPSAPTIEPEALVPAVPIKKSIAADGIICLEDGIKFRSLKRHLRTKYNLSPAEYRAKWSLPDSYPMVDPGYSAQRSALAKSHGLGTKR